MQVGPEAEEGPTWNGDLLMTVSAPGAEELLSPISNPVTLPLIWLTAKRKGASVARQSGSVPVLKGDEDMAVSWPAVEPLPAMLNAEILLEAELET